MRKSLVVFAANAAVAAAFMPAAPMSRSVADVKMSADPMGASSRRQVLGTAAAAFAGFLLPLRDAHAADAPSGPFKLPPLPYDYKALEPAIDEGASLICGRMRASSQIFSSAVVCSTRGASLFFLSLFLATATMKFHHDKHFNAVF
jgi:hypothetical protein